MNISVDFRTHIFQREEKVDVSFLRQPGTESHGRSIGLDENSCYSSAHLTERISPACARQTDMLKWKTEKQNASTAEMSTDSGQIMPSLAHTAKCFSSTRQPAQIPIHEDEAWTIPECAASVQRISYTQTGQRELENQTARHTWPLQSLL